MQTEIIDGHLVIRIPLEEPRPSSSGKTLIVASTGGNVVTSVKLNGQAITIGLNAYIKAGKPAEIVRAEMVG
jgi:hypothetical protein